MPVVDVGCGAGRGLSAPRLPGHDSGARVVIADLVHAIAARILGLKTGAHADHDQLPMTPKGLWQHCADQRTLSSNALSIRV